MRLTVYLEGEKNSRGHETMRKMKNEFMVHWDGLHTKDKECALILAATDTPFDIDETVLRRLMVNLPDASSRERILKEILSQELAPDVANGFPGCDLKNLCIAAAQRRIRELMDREKEEKRLASEGRPEPAIARK